MISGVTVIFLLSVSSSVCSEVCWRAVVCSLAGSKDPKIKRAFDDHEATSRIPACEAAHSGTLWTLALGPFRHLCFMLASANIITNMQ